MDTMISFSDNSLSNNFLTKDELLEKCPVAFKEEPTNPKVSKKYTMATTATVIEDLAKLGWYPVQAKQCRKKKNSSGIRSYHMIALQNPDIKISRDNEDGTSEVELYPRILLINSHDGFNSFKFMLGLYRVVCSNGLCISDGEFENFSIRHINYSFETLREIVCSAIKNIPSIINSINVMKQTILDEENKKDIAREVYRIRKDINEEEKISIDEDTIREILNPMRKEDENNDLWSVFNVCQEKLIKGGFHLNGKNNKTRKQRGITSIKKDIDYNQKLWNVAQRYMPATVTA